jgi:hypothetical protein
MLDGGLEFTLLFHERRHLDALQQQTVAERTEAYLALVRATMQALADQGKLRDLDIAIATKHIIQTIAGIARWHSKDSEISEDNLIEQTVNYCMSAILKR